MIIVKTVGSLRKALSGYPDEMRVAINTTETEYETFVAVDVARLTPPDFKATARPAEVDEPSLEYVVIA